MESTSTDQLETSALSTETLPSEEAQEPKKNGTGRKKKSSEEEIANAQASKEIQVRPREEAEISLKSLLEAGAHFGHQTSRWCPAMAPYLYTVRNGIHIINLPKTVALWKEARKAIIEQLSKGGSVLFVGTKKQAQEALVEEATRCGGFYVSRRWLGGMLTNFQTIKKSIERMKKLEATLAEEAEAQDSGAGARFTKKERLMMSRELGKLEFSLGGIRDMPGAPSMIFVVDIKREDIAIREARRLDIPVIALVDSNCNPAEITHPLPSNDDGARAIRLFCEAVADAVIEAKQIYKARGIEKPEVQDIQPSEETSTETSTEELKAGDSESSQTESGAPDKEPEASSTAS